MVPGEQLADAVRPHPKSADAIGRHPRDVQGREIHVWVVLEAVGAPGPRAVRWQHRDPHRPQPRVGRERLPGFTCRGACYEDLHKFPQSRERPDLEVQRA